jgi:hypothetical protein
MQPGRYSFDPGRTVMVLHVALLNYTEKREPVGSLWEQLSRYDGKSSLSLSGLQELSVKPAEVDSGKLLANPHPRR